jgi:sensor histidine kinase regulating citrate/malate metabolism
VAVLEFMLFIILNIAMFYIYIKIYESYEIKRNNDIYRMEIDLYSKHIKEKESAMQEFRRTKHDFKHQLINLRSFAEKGEYEELKNYIDELIDLKSMDNFSYVDTDNSLLDTLLNFKYEAAREQKIKFKIDVDVPYNLPFDNTDLCIILGNAIDNAIEACMYVENEEKYIDLMIKYEQGNLIIVMENIFDGNIMKDRSGNFISRKADKDNHGIGMSSIKHSLNKYHGYIDVCIEGNRYILKMIMYSHA